MIAAVLSSIVEFTRGSESFDIHHFSVDLVIKNQQRSIFQIWIIGFLFVISRKSIQSHYSVSAFSSVASIPFHFGMINFNCFVRNEIVYANENQFQNEVNCMEKKRAFNGWKINEKIWCFLENFNAIQINLVRTWNNELR